MPKPDDMLRMQQFLGLNNKSKEASLPPNTLREAVDLDLDRDGKVSSRRGYSATVIDCTMGHSLWSDDLLPFGLFADGGDLCLFADRQKEVLRSGLSPGLPVSYSLINDQVHWSNGVQRGVVGLDFEVADWACPNPDGQPELTAIAGGSLTGTVQVAVTFLDHRGRESGSTVAKVIELGLTAQGVQIDAIPQPADPAQIPRVRLYATDANGSALAHLVTLPAGIPSYTMLTPPTGRVIATQFLVPMPAGHIVRKWNSRQLVARDNIVFWSPVFRYGMVHPGHGYVRFPKRIDLLAPIAEGDAGAGVYVASGDRTYFLTGDDPSKWAQNIACLFGAVPGTDVVTPADAWGIESQRPVVAWYGKNGHNCIGTPGGQVVRYNKDTVVGFTGESGASLFRESDGLNQFLTTLRGSSLPKTGIGDSAVARVYRHDGTVS